MKICLAALCAVLVPTTALAQAPVDADPTATTPPVIVINRPPVERPTVVPTTPEYETVYDTYNAPVFTTGALIFLASYGASVVVAASSSQQELDRGNKKLYIPVAGPWLALNERGSCPLTSTSCDHETTKRVMLVAGGVFEAAGVITMIDGLLQPTSHRVPVQTSSRKLRVIPAVVGTVHANPGIAISGSF